MTVRLIKRRPDDNEEKKRDHAPSPTELMMNTQSWVEEFKAQKAKDQKSLRGILQKSAA
jgi:hypothetical protein